MKPRTYRQLLLAGETEESLAAALDEHQAAKDDFLKSERAAAQWCDRQNRLLAELQAMRLRL